MKDILPNGLIDHLEDDVYDVLEWVEDGNCMDVIQKVKDDDMFVDHEGDDDGKGCVP